MSAVVTAPRRSVLFGALERPVEPFRYVGPNWYATVMGTAIVATAAHALPVQVPALRDFAVAIWAVSAALLAGVLTARVRHLVRHWAEFRFQLLDNPATAVFYGCPPMALLAVGFGTLTVGSDAIGPHAALAVDAALWTVGTGYALAVGFGIPYLMMTRHAIGSHSADPTWLLPVVAPMVSAAVGPALIPHLPAGRPQLTLLFACYALFGASLLAVLCILPAVWARLLHTPLPAALAPTMFLVLGPLGQSVTAVNQIADSANSAAPRYAAAMSGFAVLYGVPVLGFALLWLAVSTAATLHARRQGMGFAMTWWAYTFPLGTCVTGVSGLAERLGLPALDALAVALYVTLVGAWALAAAHTVRGVLTGRLLLPAAGAAQGAARVR